MKFTNGYWQMRAGYTPHYAAQAYDIENDPNSLTVYAPTRKIQQRGDTLNLPVLTIRYSSPLEGVIRVQVVNHKGRGPQSPQFQILPQQHPPIQVINTSGFAELTSGKLAVRIDKGGEWSVTYHAGGQSLTGNGWRSLGFVDTPDGRFIHEQMSLGVGEYVYGLGERFTPFIRNGQVVDIWNEDGGTSSELAYKNIPFYLTNRGYGVFVNQPEKVSFEIGSEKVERIQFSVPGEWLDYFVIYGPAPRQILERYTALTGRPALPPSWSFGLWLSTSFTTEYDEKTITEMIDGMAERQIPLSVFHFDCFWMREFNWCDFNWDSRTFPDPVGMLRRLKDRGLKICVWINPYIAQRSPLFEEASAAGYLLKRQNGDTWQWDMWQPGMGIVDFTNPDACEWFSQKLRALQAMGVDTFKTDFGERIPLDVVYHDRSDPARMHNYYTLLYNKTVFEAIKMTRGAGDTLVFARSATVGSQQFPVHWGGDSTATFESMAESLRGGLSLGLSGFGFWSHDIGGFEHTASAAVYKRWCAFGLLSSHSRLHGSSSYRVPWLYDQEAVDVLAKFTRLKNSLMPYLYQAAVQANRTGTPMLRAMVLAFPDDPACETLDRQYMLGDSLLVAPVFREDGVVTYYLPSGKWTHFLTGETVEGGKWRQEKVDFLSIPLWVPENSVIPVGSVDHRPDYEYTDNLTLHVFPLEDGAERTIIIPDDRGNEAAVFHCVRNNNILEITHQGASKVWRVVLHDREKISPAPVRGDFLRISYLLP